MTHRTRTRTTLHEAGLALGVRAEMAREDLTARLTGDRARCLSADEGSVTAEYAMVGGVGAAAAGTAIACIKNKELLERVLEGVVTVLLKQITRWF